MEKNILIVLLMAMFLFPLMSAANLMSSPVTNGNYSTSITVTVSTESNSVYGNMTNISCYYNSTGGTAEYPGSPRFVEIYNTTTQQVNFSQAVTVSSFTQTATYNITCLVQNATGAAITLNKTLSATVVTIDYTAPTVTLNIPIGGDNSKYGAPMDYQCTISDAIDSSPTSGFNVTDPDSTKTDFTKNYATLLQFTSTSNDGDYIFACHGKDYTGNSQTKTSTVTVSKLGRTIKSTTQSTPTGNTKTIVIILLIIGLVWYFSKK